MQYINTVTDFERAHFNSSTVTVNPSTLDLQALLGMALTNEQIKKIAGAPTGSTITLYHLQQQATKGSEDIPPGVYFRIVNAAYIRGAHKIGIYRPSKLKYGVYINSVDFKAGGPKGLAARMLAVIIREALAIGNIEVLRLYAAGGRNWPPLNPQTNERWGDILRGHCMASTWNSSPIPLNSRKNSDIIRLTSKLDEKSAKC